MTTNSWKTGVGSGSFGTEGGSDSDWSLGHTPTSTEDVVINPGAIVTVTASSDEQVSSISLGTHDALSIDNDTLFAAFDGTGPNVNDGAIDVSHGVMIIGGGSSATFDQGSSGSIVLDGTSAADDAIITINGSVSLTGSGSIEMTVGDPAADNVILGDIFTNNPSLTNVSEDISGSGTIGGGGLAFTNDATVESPNGAKLVIDGSVGNGSFTNSTGGSVKADNGGTLVFGVDGQSSSIFNNGGIIDLNGTSASTKLEIAGNVTIDSSGSPGVILLGGNGVSPLGEQDDQIFSDGQPATLTLVNQQLKGAGLVDDSNLTLNNESVIDADQPVDQDHGVISLFTGENTITNTVGATMEANGGDLELSSPVENDGTIEAINGGIVDIHAGVNGPGAIDIGQNGFLGYFGVAFSNITFTGPDADIFIFNSNVPAAIAGASVTDSFDLFNHAFSASNSLRWSQAGADSGNLSLLDSSGATLESIPLAGSYVTSDFSMSEASPNFFENGGETLITIVAAVPWSTPHDYNDDGVSDLLWRNSSTGSLVTWLMNGSVITSGNNVTSGGNPVTPDSTWSVAGTGDFNGDGTADVLWRQSTIGSLVTWLMNGSAIASSAFVTSGGSTPAPDSTWSVMGVGDFNGDGDADVLWRQSTTGSLVTWLMNGSAIASSAFVTLGGNAVTVDSTWSAVGIGDFNGDGHADVLWRQSATGSVVTWLMNGSAIASSAFVTSGGSTVAPDSSWSVVGVGDFNGDGDADVLWRQSTTGSLAMWLMNGSTIASSAFVTSGGNPVMPDSTWNIVEVGDFNGTNQAGILWQQNTTGTLAEWQMNGAQIVSSRTVTSGGTPVAPASSWQVQANPSDFV